MVDGLQETLTPIVQSIALPASIAITHPDEETGRPVPAVGTGVVVSIADRIFVATVDHVRHVPPEWLVLVLPGKASNRSPKIQRSGRREREDLAWYEIDPRSLAGSSCTPVPLERLHVRSITTPALYATGFAGAYLKVDAESFLAGFFSFPTGVIGGDPLVVHWDPEHLTQPGPGYARALPPTKGMSGGGLWTYQDGLVVEVRLVALLVSETVGLKQATAILIGHWLKMLSEDLPELAPVIAAHTAREARRA